MTILCINQFFWPDLAPTSQLLTDVARRLASEGHTVTVICGSAPYSHSDPSEPPEGVGVIRVPTLEFSRGLLGRLSAYLTFFTCAGWRSFRAQHIDVVLTMTTPPLISLLGSILKKFHGCRHFIWEMDLYPEIATDLGVIKLHSRIARIMDLLANIQRHSADGIIAIGECMKQRLVSSGLDESKVFTVDNWADGATFHPRPPSPNRSLSIIYPGNFGLGHDYETLKAALPRLPMDGSIKFTFVGGGPRYQDLKSWSTTHNCRIVQFKPYCTARELASDEMPFAKVGLVLQDARCAGSIVPSKVYSMLAAGLPILYIGPANATPARIIHRFNCGWHIAPGNSAELVSLLTRLGNSPEEIRSLGARARQAFLENYDLPLGTARIISILGLVTQTQSQNSENNLLPAPQPLAKASSAP